MQKKILFGKEATEAIQIGINKVANAVCVTLGPRGKNVIITKVKTSMEGMQYWQPLVTKDGVTVAKNITLDDTIENAGCLMIREAADKTMSTCGDGTTTTCLFVQAIVNEGMKLVDGGANPQELKKEIDESVAHVVEQLKKIATPVGADIEKIRQIATISANNDPAIGNLIADAFSQIGVSGIVDIQEAKGAKTEIKIEGGFRFDKGWLSPYFITNPARNEVVLDNPLILLYDKKLTTMAPLMPIVQAVIDQQRQLLIVCDDADGEALAAIGMNAARGTLRACIVRAPGFADSKREAMEDMALLTGGAYISDEKGTSLAKATSQMLGSAKKVVVSKEETIIIEGGGKKGKAYTDLLNDLKMNQTQAEGEEKEKIETRIATLEGGVAVLYVGAPTETEMREKKDRCDDAVRATKSAIAEGYVPGGGAAFLAISSKMRPMGIIAQVIQYPLFKICENAGIDPEPILDEIVSRNDKQIGYNAKTGKIEDLIESGIIDPVKVLRSALENAASTACMVLTSACHICDSM